MSDEFGPDFITLTDEDGNDIELEFLDALEHQGVRYMAFFPAQALGDGGEPNEEDEESGIILLKAIEENGEELLSTLDDDEELEEIYDLFMERLFDEDDEDGED